MSASGKIQPKRFVNISADTSGRVVDLAVNEGDRVALGQFLMQIDPRTLRTRVESGQAALQANQAGLEQARQAVETARVQLAVAQQNLKRQQELWKQQLTPREMLERAENDVRLAQSTLAEREKQVRTQEVRLGQDRAQLASAQFDLSKVRIESPIAGIVTRRNIQEGETAVVGTMNNAGTVLLTVADMSVIQAEVEVDETNIPNVKLGQASENHDRRDTRSHVQGPRDGNRQQSDSGHRPGRHQSAGDQLQSRRRARRGSARMFGRGSRARQTSRQPHARTWSPCRFLLWRFESSSTTQKAPS